MLSTHQTTVLQHIIDNCEEYIIELAEENGITNTNASIGVAKFLVAHPDNYTKMSLNQKFHYETANQIVASSRLVNLTLCFLEDSIFRQSPLKSSISKSSNSKIAYPLKSKIYSLFTCSYQKLSGDFCPFNIIFSILIFSFLKISKNFSSLLSIGISLKILYFSINLSS